MTARGQAAIVALFCVATYAGSLLNGFALDDNYIIRGNARVHQLHDLAAIWLTPYWPTSGELLGLYRPLAIFGYALQWGVGDGAPWVFHAVNVLLHVAVSILVLLLLRRFASPLAALVGALVFAVHPVHTEVVANVVGQAEMIAAAGVLAACLVHAARPVDAARPGPARLAAMMALFGVSLLAKEGAVVLPGLLVALDAGQGRIRPEARSVSRYLRAMALPLLALGVTLCLYLLLRIHVLGSIGGVDAAPNLPFLRQDHRVFSALRAWPEYVRLLAWPFDLSADYSPAVILPASGFTPMVVLGTVLLAATFALAVLTPRWPTAGLPAAWFVIAIFPVSNLLLPIGVLLAERVLYLPSVAACFAVAAVTDSVRARATTRALRVATIGAAAMLAAFAVRSTLRSPDWKDTSAVWDALIRDHPESYRAQWVNGYRLRQRGNLDLARQYLELAYRIWPDDAQMIDALAGLYLEQGEYERAIPLLERSRELSGVLANTEVLLAYAYLTQRRYEDALASADRARPLGADPATALALRAQALEGVARFPEAADAWREAVRLPTGRSWPFWSMFARDLARLGQTADALAAADSASAAADAPRVLSGIKELRTAVMNGCYTRASAPIPGCRDPLAEWAVVLPPAAQEIAIELQNARD
ncbi:MAG: tetratricopeptide repeat protein [Gemmatimonadota bacterium]